jgi:hypothetical protein
MVKGQARGFIIDQIDRRTTDLGNVVSEHAGNLRQMSRTLRDQGQQGTAHLVEGAADRLERVSSYLTTNDGNRIVRDVETLARQQPLVTATLGLAAGVLAARVLKASATRRYQAYQQAEYETYGAPNRTTDDEPYSESAGESYRETYTEYRESTKINGL